MLRRKLEAFDEGLIVSLKHARLIVAEFDDGVNLRLKTVFIQWKCFAGVLGQVKGRHVVWVQTRGDLVHLLIDGRDEFGAGIHGENIFSIGIAL